MTDTPIPGLGEAVARLAGSVDAFTAACEAALAAGHERVRELHAHAGDVPADGGAPPHEAVLVAYDDAVAAWGDALAQCELAFNVHPDAAFREAAGEWEQRLSEALTGLSLDRQAYEALAAIDPDGLDGPTRHYLERELRDFRRAGVDRDDATRQRVRELRDELVRIGQEFGRNIREDVRRERFDPSVLDGLPADWVAAHQPGDDGRVEVTTEYPDYMPFMTYCRDADARRRLWVSFRQRADPVNAEVLDRLLRRRHELATLLGYPSWAAYITEDKMIGSDDDAAAFVERIATAAEERAAEEYRLLLEHKRRDDPHAERVDPWDHAHLEDGVKAQRYGFESQTTRPYFEYQRVARGLLDLTGELFGVAYREVPDAPRWHPEVEVYDVLDAADTGGGADGDTGAGAPLLGRIYLDMHPRPDKYGHAAQFEIVGGRRGRCLPEGGLVCNFPRPGAGGGPALLTHREVETFWHEFGHLLHHVLGGHVAWRGIAGVATEWDFVEAPSQLLEEWTRDPDVLARFAVHHETGAPIPRELVDRMVAADEFGKGLFVRQQMYYAALSLALYRADPATFDPDELSRELQERYTPWQWVEGTRFHLSFGHLDGYSAIYYTYMWSLVIAKDLFSVFRERGLLDVETARRYRQAVLDPGGGRPATELVREFLGRAHTFDAYEAWLAEGATPDQRRLATSPSRMSASETRSPGASK